MIATQLLLAEEALAMPKKSSDGEAAVCSPRKALLEIRKEPVGKALLKDFRDRVRHACRERRVGTLAKQKRRSRIHTRRAVQAVRATICGSVPWLS